MNTDEDSSFSPEPGFPQNAEFYRRVLNEWPSPVLVVNVDGEVIYGNRALAQMGGWDLGNALGDNVLDYVHPEDRAQIVETFSAVAQADASHRFADTPRASINTRLVAANGQVIPVEVTGAGGLNDSAVHGIIYDIRPAYEQDILRRGLTRLAQGEPIDEILTLITDMIALPPLDLDAAVLEPRGDGTYRVIGATNNELESILERAHDPKPWNQAAREPQRTIVSRFPGGVGEDLFAAGYRDFWHISAEATDDADTYRIVACGPEIQYPTAGPIERLSRASELASVVLLRARADALLEHSATHDRLTKLANREGFHRRGSEALAVSQAETAAVLFVDLDGFKEVNDAHGHAAGDRVLETVARRLQTVTRSIDLVARLGGDEFAILVGATSDRPVNPMRVQAIADRALHELRRSIDIGETSVRVQASIGALIAPGTATLEELLDGADAAMYQAKGLGGDQYFIVESAHPPAAKSDR